MRRGMMLQESEFEDAQDQASGLSSKLGNAMIAAKMAKQGGFEESLRRWRVEEEALIAEHEAELAEELLKEETSRRKELEAKLLRQNQETEEIYNRHAQCLKDLHTIQKEHSELIHELRRGESLEEEIREKFTQAVELLKSFKNKRDKSRVECESAVGELNKIKALQGFDPQGTTDAVFFGISFSDIVEATQNFSSSHKIGEGKYGSVYKGLHRSVQVAIRMLPSSGSQSDSEFKNEVEILSRVRHPNLVTLIGACLESRSLVYEYIDSCSLEHYLFRHAKTSPLCWQTRIRIATEICSALIFIHANTSCNVHGNLKPSSILLDPNLVTKVSDFGIHSILFPSEPLKVHRSCCRTDLAYMDPEALSTGQLTTESDLYSFGVILLQLITGRPAAVVLTEVKLGVKRGNIETLWDISAGDWPVGITEQLAFLGLRCCSKNRFNRPDLESEIYAVLEPISKLHSSSSSRNGSSKQRKVPPLFLCPIYQEVMKDPHIAGDGFTYEGDAIKEWFNRGGTNSPMTNLELQDYGLTPNNSLYYAIQEWHHNT